MNLSYLPRKGVQDRGHSQCCSLLASLCTIHGEDKRQAQHVVQVTPAEDRAQKIRYPFDEIQHGSFPSSLPVLSRTWKQVLGMIFSQI